MNFAGFGKKRSWYDQGTNLAFRRVNGGNHGNIPVSIAGVPAEIRTGVSQIQVLNIVASAYLFIGGH